MHALRGIWRASPLFKRTVTTVGAVYVGAQLKNSFYPESNVANAYFWNSTPKPAPPPPPPSPSSSQSLTQVGPYGPTSLPFSESEIRELTKSAIQLYRLSFVGCNLGVIQFVQQISQDWTEFAKEVHKLPSEGEVNQRIKNITNQFTTKLPKEAQQALDKILPILGVKNVEQIFTELAQKMRDPKTMTVADGLPNPLRVVVRFTELKRWNEYLSMSDEPDIEMLLTAPLENIPDRHAEYFLSKLKKSHPKLNDDVANLLSDVARYRAKSGVLRDFYNGMSMDELSEYDQRFDWLVSTVRWISEFQEARKNQPSLQYEQFTADRIKKEYPKISTQDAQVLTQMANAMQTLT
eukprot:Phypoly_transcript_09823.p1 GENE.Phypoly_transcript_09823~~Phypoly_transcript_09823.p1  ORF type:complete len:350 (+),score=58.69 Phypoly_transcript_09823:136-1185(+)